MITGAPGGSKDGSTGLYSYSKTHWTGNQVTYGINSSILPANVTQADYITGVTTAFNTWTNDTGSNISFTYDSNLASHLPYLNASAPDRVNMVGFADISSQYPDAIGITVTWYSRYSGGEKIIVDCDTILNSNSFFAWTQAKGVTDPDTEIIDNTNKYDVDIQNIMTHEAGHWLQLNDLYQVAAFNQTMYGIADDGDLKARTLAEGDIAGVKVIYP
jgi:hypothetical protein